MCSRTPKGGNNSNGNAPKPRRRNQLAELNGDDRFTMA